MGGLVLFLCGIVCCALVFPVYSTKVSLKINLGGERVGDYVAEHEVLEVENNMPKMNFRGMIETDSDDADVFKTQRFSRHEDMLLNIPVADGVYDVTLLFVETWKGAFEEGKRVFDVYLGSKPNGVVRVLDKLDIFKFVGGVTPLRRKFKRIVTKDGITIALRPIKQNPQIAGVIIQGTSYPDTLLENLPTSRNDESNKADMSIVDAVRPQLPEDKSLLYNPLDNPKFAHVKRALEQSKKKEQEAEAVDSLEDMPASTPSFTPNSQAQETDTENETVANQFTPTSSAQPTIAAAINPSDGEASLIPQTPVVTITSTPAVVAKSPVPAIEGVPPIGANLDGRANAGGLCVNDDTHCTCGQSIRIPSGECLYIENEQAKPMICRRDLCRPPLLCACAPGANHLCKKSLAHSILVADVVEGQKEVQSKYVNCKRETLEDGAPILEVVM